VKYDVVTNYGKLMEIVGMGGASALDLALDLERPGQKHAFFLTLLEPRYCRMFPLNKEDAYSGAQGHSFRNMQEELQKWIK